MIFGDYMRDGVRYYNGRPVNRTAAKPGTLGYRIMQAIDGPTTAKELAEHLNAKKPQVTWFLAKLAERGMIERIERGVYRRKP